MRIIDLFGWLGFMTVIFCLIALYFSQIVLTLLLLTLSFVWLGLDEFIWRKF